MRITEIELIFLSTNTICDVCGDTFILAILFTPTFTDRVIAAKCPYDEIPGIFLKEHH